LEKAGADLVSLSERIDTTSAAGKMIFRLLAVLNEFERDQISERTASALQHKKQQRRAYSPTPSGFDRIGDTLVENTEETEVLTRIRALRSEGWSYERIAAELNREGIPAKKGGTWCLSSVRSVLRATPDR